MRNLVLFPGTVAPVSIGRPGLIKLFEESLPKSKPPFRRDDLSTLAKTEQANRPRRF
jgi:hypothetical protein